MEKAEAKGLKVSLSINFEIDRETLVFLISLAIFIFHPELLELANALASRF